MTRTVNVPPNGTADFVMRTAIPTPFLAPPITGSTTSDALRGSTNGAGAGRVNAWFDHVYPIYGEDTNNIVRNHVGITVTAGCGLGSPGCYNGHSGTDFRTTVTATDNPIYAAAAGVVTNVVRVDQGGYGIHLWIDHENGYATLYGHLRAGSIPMTLTNGTRVVAGQQIGIMGNTGQSTGTHLHLGVYYDANGDLGWTEFQAPNEVVDPFGWMLFPDRPSPPDPWPVPSFYLWRYRIDSQTAAGASGAVLSSPSDTARVNVPPGALVYTVTLQLMDAPPVAGASAQLRSTGRSSWLRILEWLFGGSTSGPVLPASDGFAQPLTITMNYSDTDAMHLSEIELAIYRWSEASSAWVALPTSVDTVRNQALAQTTETGNFDLQAPLICPAGAEEPNDNYYAASLLPPNGTPQSQLFDIATDEDWFRLEATAGGKYVVQTSNLAAGVDTTLEIFDRDGLATLASDDNGGGNAASRLEWHAPASGTYFIRVTQAPGSAYGCSASYDVSVSQELWVYLPIALRNR
jgi:murein DD-endopeptidase MepM/ murein hydrolase activator NlpD